MGTWRRSARSAVFEVSKTLLSHKPLPPSRLAPGHKLVEERFAQMEANQNVGQYRRMATPRAIRERVFAKFGSQCVLCGIDNDSVPLEIAYIQPVSVGGGVGEENLILLCPNCHVVFDSTPREMEFESFLTELLRKHSDFKNVRSEALIGSNTRFRADLLADRVAHTGRERLLIECKKAPLPPSRLPELISKMRKYQDSYGDCRLVLALPATLSPQDLAYLSHQHIELWDLSYIANTFKDQIAEASPGYYKLLFSVQIGKSPKLSQEQKFISELKGLKPGIKDWSVYQKLVGRILELLFCPELVKPISELSDATQTNRRDFILPNYAESGFWSFMRTMYKADYVVVDAKNYTDKIKKNQILQLANYLKAHGAGLFGMIICRKGADSGGSQVTLRDEWVERQRLILILNDEDVESMLLAKSDGRNPASEVIGRKIEEFRLSL